MARGAAVRPPREAAVMVAPAMPPEGRARRRILVQGVVQGVGFRPFVYATASELMLTGSVTNSSAGVSSRSREHRGRRRVPSAGSSSAAAARRRRSGRAPLDVRPRGGTVSPSARPPPARPAATLASPGRRHVRRLPARAVRPRRPPLPPPVHHLHQLRPALHHHRSLPYDRATTTMARFRAVRQVRRRVRRPRRPPLPRPADRLPRLRPTLELVERGGGRRTGRRGGALAGAAGAPRRRRRSWR